MTDVFGTAGIQALPTREGPLALNELANNSVRRIPLSLRFHDFLPPSPSRASEADNTWITLGPPRDRPEWNRSRSSTARCTTPAPPLRRHPDSSLDRGRPIIENRLKGPDMAP